MSNSNGFFGDIFDSTEDDPLLQSDQDAFDANGDRSPQSENELSSEAPPRDAHAGSSQPEPDATEVQEVVLHQTESNTHGLEDLNEAVEDGWRVSHISLDDRIRSASGDVETEIIVLLERNTPRSLFDFGGPY